MTGLVPCFPDAVPRKRVNLCQGGPAPTPHSRTKELALCLALQAAVGPLGRLFSGAAVCPLKDSPRGRTGHNQLSPSYQLHQCKAGTFPEGGVTWDRVSASGRAWELWPQPSVDQLPHPHPQKTADKLSKEEKCSVAQLSFKRRKDSGREKWYQAWHVDYFRGAVVPRVLSSLGPGDIILFFPQVWTTPCKSLHGKLKSLYTKHPGKKCCCHRRGLCNMSSLTKRTRKNIVSALQSTSALHTPTPPHTHTCTSTQTRAHACTHTHLPLLEDSMSVFCG